MKYDFVLYCLQKHQRTPSQAELNDFKTLTKLDASLSLSKELNKLLLTAPPNEIEVI